VLAKTLRDLRPAFQRLHDGLSFNIWNGRCFIPRITDAAKKAEWEILATLRQMEDNPSNLVDVQEVAHWLRHFTAEDLWLKGWTLKEVVAWVQEDAKSLNVHLLGSVADYLMKLKKKEES